MTSDNLPERQPQPMSPKIAHALRELAAARQRLLGRLDPADLPLLVVEDEATSVRPDFAALVRAARQTELAPPTARRPLVVTPGAFITDSAAGRNLLPNPSDDDAQ
ncbi:hypothetical protein [Actinophytocola sp.]|uniref:hypothetical protein n=1 Tax=Actinophytocola sp. TaxID=1872138 RepID=UPI002ED56ACB